MPELAVVLTYYQREKQLLKTLDSFRQYNPDLFNVYIVDDNSPDNINIEELNKYSFGITVHKLLEKKWINPGPTFNIGFADALQDKPKFILLQNAECYHNGDVIGYVLRNLTERNYITFACYSLGSGEDVDLKELNNISARGNGDSAWYNHSRYRPLALHFCAAITANNLKKINGFDERLSQGLGYEDDLFIHQVRTLGLKVQIVDSPFVFHQYHYDVKAFNFVQEQYSRNCSYCSQIRKEKRYKAVHLITENL